MPDKALVVIGDGPEHQRIREMAKDAPNIQILGHQPFRALKDYMQRSQGICFRGQGGISASWFWKPSPAARRSIALGQGAARETVLGGKTGVFFAEQTVASLKDAVARFEQQRFDAAGLPRKRPAVLRSPFREAFSAFVAGATARWRARNEVA